MSGVELGKGGAWGDIVVTTGEVETWAKHALAKIEELVLV